MVSNQTEHTLTVYTLVILRLATTDRRKRVVTTATLGRYDKRRHSSNSHNIIRVYSDIYIIFLFYFILTCVKINRLHFYHP